MSSPYQNFSAEETEKLVNAELQFVQSQMADEERRREVIEGKTGQLLGQVSIVISIISLFIPLISDQLSSFPIWGRIVCIILFLLIVVAYIISIWIASTTWVISRYGYSRASLEDIKKQGENQSYIDFMEGHKVVIQETIVQHVGLNNKKGTKLIRAGLAFRWGTLLLGILVLSLSIGLSLINSKANNIHNESLPVKVDSAQSR